MDSDDTTRAGRLLPEHEAWEFLRRNGVATPLQVFTSSLAGVLAAAEQLGFPLVIKRLVEGTAHKRSLGLVQSGIHGRESLMKAWDALAKGYIKESVNGAAYLVQQHVIGEMEVFIGVRRDPVFGLVSVLGQGGAGLRMGTSVQLLSHEAAQGADHILASEPEVLRAVGHLRNGHDLVSELKRLVRLMEKAATGSGRVVEVELNPVIVGDHGVTPVDVCVRTDDKVEK